RQLVLDLLAADGQLGEVRLEQLAVGETNGIRVAIVLWAGGHHCHAAAGAQAAVRQRLVHPWADPPGPGEHGGWEKMTEGMLFQGHGRLSCQPGASSAKARTGKVPMPRNLTGTAKKRKPASGNCSRPRRCSTMGISAPSKVECTGRAASAVSSMLNESMPT